MTRSLEVKEKSPERGIGSFLTRVGQVSSVLTLIAPGAPPLSFPPVPPAVAPELFSALGCSIYTYPFCLLDFHMFPCNSLDAKQETPFTFSL